MKILIGELQNLMKNEPLFPGATLSHQSMKELYDNGLATRDEDGNYVSTDFGKIVYNRLMGKTLTIEPQLSIEER